jgi:hypothetical protein
MSKPIYRARLTTKKGDYRVREFASQVNAIKWATQMVNEGATGYIERQSYAPGFMGGARTEAVWHSDQAVKKCDVALIAEAA